MWSVIYFNIRFPDNEAEILPILPRDSVWKIKERLNTRKSSER